MESNLENFSSTENSVSLPFRKRKKTLSDQDGDQSDSILHQEEQSHLSLELAEASKQAPKNHIKIFAAQCAQCQNWRLISTKKKYEEIRERIREVPFVCEKAHEWNPDVTCNDPSDVSQEDSSKLWAIDKPNIPQAPPGWERLIKIRPKGDTQFADVFYKPPTGNMQRSLNDIEKYLGNHPEYVAQGVELSQFSFEMPAPLQKDYVRKRSQKRQSDAPHTGGTELLQPDEEAQHIDWAATSVLMSLDPAQPSIDRAAALAQGDPGDNNEDQPEVAQPEELQEATTKPDSPPPAPTA
ncbi:unnamed protein product [Urochloa decumbens]|uniref:Methyl-CpG-binding domain-containing protein 2 n=1 Tax=Urochloa decumbens TaxID=240449 RepID=A0ABC9BV50_9POAL